MEKRGYIHPDWTPPVDDKPGQPLRPLDCTKTEQLKQLEQHFSKQAAETVTNKQLQK